MTPCRRDLPSALLLLTLVLGCAAAEAPPRVLDGIPLQPEIAITEPPYRKVVVDFKETLDLPYVYVEHQGSYDDLRQSVQRLIAALEAQGLEPRGPLFGLFYDDPKSLPKASHVARLGVPVDVGTRARAPLFGDRTGTRTVVYAVAAGDFGSGRRVLPALYQRMKDWGWVQSGPVMEIYGFPAPDDPSGRFLTEVQIPWQPTR